MKHNSKKHRTKTIELWESQLYDAGPFITLVLKEGIRKLKVTGKFEMKPMDIEQWVVTLEKNWRSFPRMGWFKKWIYKTF